ncbi:ABC transporter permease [Deinococcus cellulosilyticus]|uniref:Osmoprotectant uptake system permease n=1 Tax=Deinococcus cellulosilyticus (strain DSM 18568 / NBRC 106333 / KACC 11606 / 5516J-15) TaxID=1223518 RepID=A0A511N1Q0_DEIC1|nr:ABC transporter permease [Deinococcus cellulosilyticus]GEM46749.1 osmoprotectant uptake system permease [Deinococcus cellulosilyticus NBRC 106333 = KACC 11606]
MKRVARRSPFTALIWSALLLVALIPGLLPRLLAPLSAGTPPETDRPLWQLTLDHLLLVLLAEGIILLLALPLVVFVTRPHNQSFLRLTETLTGLGQTVPTLAILALAVPALGFGVYPTLLGLILYGLVPVISNGIAGLLSVDEGVLDAATGTGMTGLQKLLRIEFPLAMPVLLAGIRTSTVYNVGTATIGAALGAGGLGSPIINGLSQQNTGLVMVGALCAALLALTLDALIGLIATGDAAPQAR